MKRKNTKPAPRRSTKRIRKMVRWADKFDLQKTRTDKHFNPHLYRQAFWHGDGTPAVKVTLTWRPK